MDTSTAKRRALGVLLLLASSTGIACSSSEPTPAAVAPPVLKTDEAGKFSAEFPSAPFREESRTTASGIDLLIISFSTESATESLVVGYTDYPKSVQLPRVLDGAAQGSAAQVNGTIQSKTSTTFMGHPAMDLVVKTSEAMIHERLVLRGNRLYTLIGVGPSGRPASYDRLLETFFLI